MALNNIKPITNIHLYSSVNRNSVQYDFTCTSIVLLIIRKLLIYMIDKKSLYSCKSSSNITLNYVGTRNLKLYNYTILYTASPCKQPKSSYNICTRILTLNIISILLLRAHLQGGCGTQGPKV